MALDIDQKDGGLSVVNFGAQVSCLLRMQGRYKGVEGGTEMGNGGGKEGDRGGGRGNEWGGREGWGGKGGGAGGGGGREGSRERHRRNMAGHSLLCRLFASLCAVLACCMLYLLVACVACLHTVLHFLRAVLAYPLTRGFAWLSCSACILACLRTFFLLAGMLCLLAHSPTSSLAC